MKPKVQQKLVDPSRCKYESRGDHSWNQSIKLKYKNGLKLNYTWNIHLLPLFGNRLSSAKTWASSPCCRTSRGNSEMFASCSLTSCLMDEASSVPINPLITIESIRRSNSHNRDDLSALLYTWLNIFKRIVSVSSHHTLVNSRKKNK